MPETDWDSWRGSLYESFHLWSREAGSLPRLTGRKVWESVFLTTLFLPLDLLVILSSSQVKLEGRVQGSLLMQLTQVSFPGHSRLQKGGGDLEGQMGDLQDSTLPPGMLSIPPLP